MNTLICAAILLAVVFVAGGSTGKVPLATVGPKTFYTIEGKDAVLWDEAVAACAQAGLKTAVVKNKAESNALSAASLQRAKEDKHHYLWLGAILKNGKWIWASTGKELTYTNWSPDATLNDPGDSPESGYNCGYINTHPTWNTWACGSEGGVPVCQ